MASNARPALARSLAALLALMLAANGCGTSATAPVVVDGSSTVYPISVAAQEAYTDSLPEVPRITVNQSGTGGGFGRYNQREVDIVDASRPAKPEEQEAAERQGLDWTRYIVGHDGITVAVNPANDFVEALSVDQLQALFKPGSTVRTWRDLDPDWPDREIILYTPDDDSGTYDFFLEAVGLDPKKGQRKDVQPSSDDNVLVNGIAGDAGALGYFGFAYFQENRGKLRAVPIRESDGAEAVAPSPETIYDGNYLPLSRPLFIYVKKTAMSTRPEVRGFVSFYLEHVADLAERAGYVAPTDEEQAENREAFGGRDADPAE